MEKSVDISKNKKQIYKDYMKELQDNPVNKRSLWLNFIAFFIPIWGIFLYIFLLFVPLWM